MKIQYRSNRNKSCHNPINMDTHVSQVIESKPQKHKWDDNNDKEMIKEWGKKEKDEERERKKK